MKFNKTFLLLCLFCLSASAFSQKTWEKPLEKWSKDDALKILSASPWAQTYQSPVGAAGADQRQIARQQSQTANSGGSNPQSIARNFGPPPVVIRLHSALPVRQAITRMQQIEANYNKLDDKQKAQFDANAKSYLDCAICQNYYVITLTQFSDSSGQSVEEGIFQGSKLADLKGNIWLVNDKGEQRELVQFTPPKGRGDSAVFFFSRKDDKGNEFLAPDRKDFKLVFKNEFLTAPDNRYAYLIPRNFEFKVSKMLMNERVEF